MPTASYLTQRGRYALGTLSLATALALSTVQAPALAAAPSTASVAWLPAAADADIEAAFAQARAEKKPVLLYWGAKWCPPCNQLKATLFNRQDFIQQSRGLVAVNIDGDLPGAQKLGTRFKVRGYPTMILFNPAGNELTRLPGEADATQVMQVLQVGLAGGRPIKAVLDDARAGKTLSANEWRLLAFYSWDTDEQQLISPTELPALLGQLATASASVDAALSTRLAFKSLALSSQAQAKDAKAEAKGIKVDAALRDKVQAVLSDPTAARLHMDLLVNHADDMVQGLVKAGADKKALLDSFDAALNKLQADASLSRADRVGALIARISLARMDQPKDALQVKLPAALLTQVREHVARDDREITDGYERQAVISSDAYALSLAGLWAESDALLQASLSKSHSPYYLMSQLAGNAKRQGRKEDALKWYAESFNKSEGPATRLQWGSGYLSALIELSPQDSARIEKVSAQLFNEAAQDKGAFYERSARSLQRVGIKLVGWNGKGEHEAVIGRLKTQLDGICAKVDSADKQRATCEALLNKAGAKKG